MQPFLAFVMPVSGGQHPDQGLPGGGNFPAHPIAPGGGGGYPSQPIYWPTYPDNSLPGGGGGGGRPSHPIALPPPGINIPVFPSLPIAPGGGGGSPDNSLPGGTGSGARPDNSLPGDGLVLIFHPSFGWIMVPIGSLGGGHPDNSLPGGGSGSGNKPTQPINPTPTPKA